MMKTMHPLLVALALFALQAGDPALASTAEPLATPTTQPAPPSATNGFPAMPADPSVRTDAQGCCNGMGGPVEAEPEVLVEHFADPAGDWRRWVAPTDSNLERRYAPRPARSLNPIILRF